VRGGISERTGGDSMRGEEEGRSKDALGRNACGGGMDLAPIARRIMLSIIKTVFELTCTAWPLIACTPARPLRVLSDVRKTSARGGKGGGACKDVFLKVSSLEGWPPVVEGVE
jgi:hypothetical protein